MCDDDIDPGFEDSKVSRRTFGVLAAVAAGAASAVTTSAYAATTVEKDVTIKTPDGMADAALYYPQGRGSWPAVIMWPDIMTLRPVFREMGARLASEGYVVLVPNFYYRNQKAPIALNFSNPADRAGFGPLRAPLNEAAMDRDAAAFVAYLDSLPQTNKRKKIGVQGYCMGGPYSFRTAAVAPNRIGAVASFHGGGLTVVANPANPAAPTAAAIANSPHLLVAKTKADYLVAIAQNDDRGQPASKDILRKTFADAKVRGKADVYPADHGWMVRGSAVYDANAAERGWAEMLSQYQRALV